MKVQGVLMTERWDAADRRETAAEKVVEIKVRPQPIVCTQRVAECSAARNDWVCGACGQGFVTAAHGARCNVCDAEVVAISYL